MPAQGVAFQGHCALAYPGRATLTARICGAFSDTTTVASGTHGPGNRSDAVKQAVLVGLCRRQESARALAEKSGLVGRRSMLGKPGSLAQILGFGAPATMKCKTSALLYPYPELDALARRREALQRDIRELRIEHDRLKPARDVAKRDLGGDLQGPEVIVTGQSGKDHADRRPEKTV